MVPRPSQTETIIALSFALGGLENILSVENCLSRLRIFTKSPPPADDKGFLSLGVLGVVRMQDQIHLICGTEAIALRQAFQCLIDAEKDASSLMLLAYAGGSGNISKLISGSEGLELLLNSPAELPLIPGLDITRKGSSVFITPQGTAPELLAIHVQSALLFWDFLYTLNIYRLFRSVGIKNFSACRTRLRLKLSSLKDLPLPCPALALGVLPVQEEAGEVHIPCPHRAEPYAALLKRFISLYEKKKYI